MRSKNGGKVKQSLREEMSRHSLDTLSLRWSTGNRSGQNTIIGPGANNMSTKSRRKDESVKDTIPELRTVVSDSRGSLATVERASKDVDSAKPTSITPGSALDAAQDISSDDQHLVKTFRERFDTGEHSSPSSDADSKSNPSVKDVVNSLDRIEKRIESNLGKSSAGDQSATSIVLDCIHQLQQLREDTKVLTAKTDSIEKGTERKWDFPKVLTTIILAVATLAFAANFVHQYTVTRGVDDRVKDMQTQLQFAVKYSEGAVKRSEDTVRNLSGSLGQLGERITEEKNGLEEQFEKQFAKMELQHQQAKESQLVAIRTAGAVYDAIGMISLGNSQLANGNPQQAEAYAKQALTVIRQAEESIADGSGLKTSLRQIRRQAWILQAQSLHEIGDVPGVTEVATSLLNKECNCPEGEHYLGIIRLYTSANEALDKSVRSSARVDGISQLDRAVRRERRGNTDLVLLAAAYFDGGNFQLASDNASEFLRNVPVRIEGRTKLSDTTRAYTHLARIWKSLADLALSTNGSDVHSPSGCDVIPNAIGVIEGRTFERLLLEARRSSVWLDLGSDEKIQKARTICDSAVAWVRGTSSPGACAPRAVHGIPDAAPPPAAEAAPAPAPAPPTEPAPAPRASTLVPVPAKADKKA